MTGYVINEKLNVSADYRRQIWQVIFDSYIELFEEIESKVEYDCIGIGQGNDGLTMRKGGYKSVVYKMK